MAGLVEAVRLLVALYPVLQVEAEVETMMLAEVPLLLEMPLRVVVQTEVREEMLVMQLPILAVAAAAVEELAVEQIWVEMAAQE
jgi:hypothetical protein